MHARVSSYQSDDPHSLIEGFKNVSEELQQVDGFSHAYFMVDPGSGKAISVTIWESEDALRASSAKADELREKGTTPSGTSITSVEHYEIPLTVRAHTTTGA